MTYRFQIRWFNIFIILFLASISYSASADEEVPGFLTDPKNNCRVWTFNVTNRSVDWSGPCAKGYANGKGFYNLYENGNIINRIEGNLIDGKLNGLGKESAPDGTVIMGFYKNHQLNGSGQITYSDGSVFVGNFKNDKKTGKGSISYSNGDIFEGEFLNDLKQGPGVLTNSNGSKVSGLWIDDKLVKKDNPDTTDQSSSSKSNRKMLSPGETFLEMRKLVCKNRGLEGARLYFSKDSEAFYQALLIIT